jgi:hypothetical protein
MATERWSRRTMLATATPLALWPQCTESGIRDLECYRQRVTAMQLYFDNHPVKAIEAATGVPRTMLAHWAKRCLALAPDGRIQGFRALIPYTRTTPYQRTQPVAKKWPEAKGGMAGALDQLFGEFPDLENDLIARIIKDRKSHPHPHEFRIRPKDVHRHFIAALRVLGIGDERWPFTAKYRGRRSIERYTNEVLLRRFTRSVAARGDDAANAHLHVGRGFSPLVAFSRPFGAVEIDAYSINALLTVAVQTPEGTEVELLLERLWLIAAVDRASTAILAHTLVYGSQVGAADVVRVIRLASSEGIALRPALNALTGLTYPPLKPAEQRAIETFAGALWAATLLDNALAHLATAVHDTARKALGFALNYGPVRHFERRPNVERAFRAISDEIFQRLPSTTGSHPKAGRAADADAQALRWRIRATDIEELVAVYLAQHNGTPSEGISNLSPLEFLGYFATHEDGHLLPRRLPAAQQVTQATLGRQIRCVVRGNLAQGRRPYIQIDRVHHTNPVLAMSGQLIGVELIVDLDEDDMRQVRASLPNGGDLGFLGAAGRWGETPHTRKTRKAINSLLSRGILVLSEFDDPIQVYLRYLGTQRRSRSDSDTESAVREQMSPRDTTLLTRVAREAGMPPVLHAPTVPSPVVPEPPRRSVMNKPLPNFATIKNRR